MRKQAICCHTVSFTVGSSAFMRIYFTKIGAGSVVKLADQQENIMRVNLSELKNESGDFMLLFNESRVDLLHSFLAGLDIWKCLFCLGLIAALFLFDLFAVKQIWRFLEHGTQPYRLLEILKAGVLFFLLLLGTIYPVLDLLPTAAVFAGFGTLLALLLFRIRGGYLYRMHMRYLLYILEFPCCFYCQCFVCRMSFAILRIFMRNRFCQKKCMEEQKGRN